MTASGKRHIQNHMEMVTSDGWNQAQALASFSRDELFRYLLTVSDTYALQQEPTTSLYAVVFGGLLPIPVSGSTAMTVGGGAALFVDPDASPSGDDSPAKLVLSDGVTSLSPLTLTANSSGSTRIDVIECSRVDTVLSTANVNIFNEATGAYTPSAENKVGQHQLTFRIRLGTPGAGLPALATGWLPLAVARVPNATTTWDTCTLWDVRPLTSDRAEGLGVGYGYGADGVVQGEAKHIEGKWHLDAKYAFTSTGTARLRGNARSMLLGRRVGGAGNFVPWNDTDLSTQGIDFNVMSVNNQEPGWTLTGGRFSYVYAVIPDAYGPMARWALYTPQTFVTVFGSSVKRRPLDFLGIPVVSAVGPSLGKNEVAAISLPTSLGLGGAGKAVPLASFYEHATGPQILTTAYDGELAQCAGFAGPGSLGVPIIALAQIGVTEWWSTNLNLATIPKNATFLYGLIDVHRGNAAAAVEMITSVMMGTSLTDWQDAGSTIYNGVLCARANTLTPYNTVPASDHIAIPVRLPLFFATSGNHLLVRVQYAPSLTGVSFYLSGWGYS
jgi:hypothetical protein